MTKSTKLGLILAAVHTFSVSVALLMIVAGNGVHTRPLWQLLIAIDLPAFILWIFEPFQIPDPWYQSQYLPLLFGPIGGAWWFSIGWLIAWTHSHFAVSTAKVRFASGFAISAVAIFLALAVQFVVTISNVAHGGCASVGFPISFFQGCYGTLNLYWPAMTVSRGPLLVDVIVWLALAILFTSSLSIKWKFKEH